MSMVGASVLLWNDLQADVHNGFCMLLFPLNAAAKGISQYDVAEDAAESLDHCLREAFNVVPRKHHHSAPLYLGATAGMRLLQ